MVSLARIKGTAQAANQSRFPLLSVLQRHERVFVRDGVGIFHGDAMDLYSRWPTPVVIVSDGAYGLGRFPGDPHTADKLADWYRPHIRKWSEYSTPQTTLWFWNSELGWATLHPILLEHGWRFVNCHVWDKGLSHAAGNSNTKTLRKLPVVSEPLWEALFLCGRCETVAATRVGENARQVLLQSRCHQRLAGASLEWRGTREAGHP